MNSTLHSPTYLTVITALFVTVLLVSNIASSKLTSFWWLVFDAGTLLFPLSYIFNDVLTEVYGYKVSRRVIWTGFGCVLLASLVFIVVGMLPSAPDWPYQSSYEAILGLTPRIVFASLVAYLIGEFANSYILARMKVAMQGKQFWVRAIGSTIIGQLLDSAVFVLIAFSGLFSFSVIVMIVVSNFIFKTLVEIVLLPITYKVVAFLKRKEGVDYYDRDTRFNPFSFGR